MKKDNKKKEKIHLTDHYTYQIIDSVIYIFEERQTTLEETKKLLEKVSLLIESENILYINLTGKNMEARKAHYIGLGFSLAYYSVDKLNTLYKGHNDKKQFRCYAVMPKEDLLNMTNKGQKKIKLNSSNEGFISNVLLLFTGVMILCYLIIQASIILIGR